MGTLRTKKKKERVGGEKKPSRGGEGEVWWD